MKASLRCLVIALIGVLPGGCLFKAKTVSVSHFVLAPICTNTLVSAPVDHLSLGIQYVKMPPYLLRDSMAVRNGDNQIEYLDTARWGERLDQSFQRALAVNLSRLLPSDNIYLTDWSSDQIMARVSISVDQFDVDVRGQGTLIAEWRIRRPDSDTVLKSGTARLSRSGPSPHGKPGTIAATLSDLVADFSRDLAPSIRASVKTGP